MSEHNDACCVHCGPALEDALELAPGRVYRAVLIRPGEWAGKGIRCPAEVLRREVHKFNGLASFLNPPPPQPGQHGHPMLERLLGMTENARWDEAVPPLPGGTEAGGVVADYRLAGTDAASGFRRLVDGWLKAKAAGRPVPAIGLSAVPWVRLGPADAAGMREVREIVSVEQVDAVYRPAAGGEFVKVLNSVLAPDGMQTGEEGVMAEEVEGVGGAQDVADLASAMRESVLEAKLALSGLPPRWRKVVSDGLPAAWQAGELDAAIQRVKAACAEDEAAHTVQGIRPLAGQGSLAGGATITGMQTGLDQIEEAAAAMIEGRGPRRGVRPLTGPRELYLLLSGDYEMTGLFHPERVYLANVNSTTMSNLVANVLNKRIVEEFQSYPRWWEPFVRRETFNTLQDIKWVTLGGVGELPAVAEGAAYTELTWPDASQPATWQKRGGYLGLTLEALDKDDLSKLKAAPPALAQAAWLTLGKSVAGIFTSPTAAGPTLADGTALFHTDRANLGTAALSVASWNAAKLAMRKQTELGSGERLGALTSPRYLLVPPDLEGTALQVLASEADYTYALSNGVAAPVNVNAQGNSFDARMEAARRRVVVIDLWTDANDWAAAADPRLYPTIGLAFRYGEAPEIFSVASPTSGLMFSNDVMPVKVRWFYAAGPMDHRGLYKANVA